MKWFYWIAGCALVAVVLIVLFVPGVGDNIEGRLLRWMAGAGSKRPEPHGEPSLSTPAEAP